MIFVDMAASELGFDLHYSNSGEYFILVDYQKGLVNMFGDSEFNRDMAINWMIKERNRQKRRERKNEVKND